MKKLIYLLCLFFVTSLAVTAQVSSSDEALAFQYYQNGEYDKAVVIYKKLFEKKNVSVYDQYYNSLLRLKEFGQAEKIVRHQLKNSPGSYMYSVDLGRIYQEQGDAKKAEAWYEGLIKELPRDEASIRDLATNFYRAEAYPMAVKTFTAGRKLLNNDQAFTFDLIGLYRFRKEKGLLINEYIHLLTDNPSVLSQAQSVIGHVLEDNDDYELLKTGLLRVIQKQPQNTALSELLTWTYVQQSDYKMALRQTLAMDRRLREDGGRVYELARLMVNNREYETAIEALEYVVGKGPGNELYVPAKIEIINARSQLVSQGKYGQKDLMTLEKEYQDLLTEFGTTVRTAFAVRQLAKLQAFRLNKPKEAEVLLEDLSNIRGIPPDVLAQIKLELGDIYILTGEVWEANLIYGQVEKQFSNSPLGQEAKFRNGRLSYYQGDFTWAKAQLDVLKSATSQLIANDALNLSLLISDNLQNPTDSSALKMYAHADMLLTINQEEKALGTLDSIDFKYPGHSLTDDILMSKAKIFEKRSEFSRAADQLQKIVDNYSFDLWADDAIFMLADLFENKLQQQDKARVLYERIITQYPGSLYVVEARKRFRNLRGDKLG